MAPLLPQILWAQRKDRVLITVDLQDAKQPDIKLENKALGKHFLNSAAAYGAGVVSFASQARSHATGMDLHEYATTLELFGEINVEESQTSVTDRRVLVLAAKKAEDTEHWPRLLKSKDKKSNIKVDWSKWVDEDEEDGDKKDDFDLADLQKYSGGGGFGGGGPGGGFDLSGLGGAGGGAGISGMNLEDEDSDDEDLPDLAPAEGSSK